MPLPDATTLDLFGVAGFAGLDAKPEVNSPSLDVPYIRGGVFLAVAEAAGGEGGGDLEGSDAAASAFRRARRAHRYRLAPAAP
jgi:hypothetical protein